MSRPARSVVRRLLRAVTVGAVVLLAATGCFGSGDAQALPTAAGPKPPPGVVDYRLSHPEWLTDVARIGALSYPTSPPMGGDHSPYFQNCAGDIYPYPVPNEYAVTSMEHGAVWVTYQPDLDPAQVRLLVDRVRGAPYVFSSPYPGLDRPVSLQAWGYQLKLDSADDPAIDEFIAAYRITAAAVPGAPCAGGMQTTERGPDLAGPETPSPSPGVSGSPGSSASPTASPGASATGGPTGSPTPRGTASPSATPRH